MTTFEPPQPFVPGHFREAVYKIAPPWLRNNWGVRFLYSLGIQLDGVAEYFRIGQLQRFPDYCVEEALEHLGKDRRIARGPNEPAAAYRARLKAWLTTWKYAGHPKAVLGQIAAYYSPSPPVIRYVSNGYDASGNTVADWWTLSAGVYTYQRRSSTNANWNWDGVWGGYRFWIIVYTDLLPTWSWDEPVNWDEPGLLWGFKNGQVVTDLLSIIDDWKCAGTHLSHLIFSSATTEKYLRWDEFFWDGAIWNQTSTVNAFDPNNGPGQPMPDGTWADPNNRDPAAQYFQGV